LAALHVSSDIIAHHQEHYSFWFHSHVLLSAAVVAQPQQHTRMNPEAVITVTMLLMMSDNIARNMFSSQGTMA
jgi:hypothetical protein